MHLWGSHALPEVVYVKKRKGESMKNIIPDINSRDLEKGQSQKT